MAFYPDMSMGPRLADPIRVLTLPALLVHVPTLRPIDRSIPLHLFLHMLGDGIIAVLALPDDDRLVCDRVFAITLFR